MWYLSIPRVYKYTEFVKFQEITSALDTPIFNAEVRFMFVYFGQFDMVLTEGLDRLSRDQEHIAGQKPDTKA